MPLFEAARWAPSANNAQPWRFVYGLRGDAGFGRILGCLKPSNAIWAERAACLIMASAQTVRDTGETNRHAAHDLGQALAYLVLQATAQGLATHQMAGFDYERARTDLGIPEGHEPMTAVAVGWLGEAATLPEELKQRESAPRTRKPVGGFAHPGRWPVLVPGGA